MAARPYSSFARLALITTLATYLLILVGGLVRASGAGLGCPDWPRCFGTWIPPASAAELPPGFEPGQFNATLMWTEYLNRLLGVVVGLLMLATAAAAVRHHRRDSRVLWPMLAALLLTGFQGWLGGRVVALELASWIVTAHLLVALVIVSLLLYVTVYARLRRDGRLQGHLPAPGTTALATDAALVIWLVLLQIALGTQVRGGVDAAIGAGAPRETALSLVGGVDRAHRTVALLVIVGTAWLAWRARRNAVDRPRLARVALLAAGLAVAQVGVGAGLAYAALPPAAQVAHLGVATALVSALMLFVLYLRWLPSGPS